MPVGFTVYVVVTVTKPVTEALMSTLDHQFEVANHEAGSRSIELAEHVSVSNEADAIAFVRALADDALPQGTVISSIEAAQD